MCRQDEAGFPQKQLETAFLHSLRLLEQNREYLQMHLQPLKDARTAQALEDMEQEAARLERTFRELMELSAPEGRCRSGRWTCAACWRSWKGCAARSTPRAARSSP